MGFDWLIHSVFCGSPYKGLYSLLSHNVEMKEREDGRGSGEMEYWSDREHWADGMKQAMVALQTWGCFARLEK